METSRLVLKKLDITNAEFILRLLNTKEWIQFIGDRNIKNKEDALAYIQKIINNPGITYWVMNLKSQSIPVGIISLVKRDYLVYPDIGFALLPEHTGKGYAAEGAKQVLDSLTAGKTYPVIYAITVKDNSKSIHLLEKLGLKFEKEMDIDNETLLIYSTVL